jgi:hypothetical protein
MDSDISHAVEERLTAIELRLDELEGVTPGETEDTEETEGEATLYVGSKE